MSTISETVMRKVRKLFPDSDTELVSSHLERYGTESYETAVERVHLAILKASSGSVSEVHKFVDIAKSDPRDVIMFAEYPREGMLDAADYDPPSQRLKIAQREDIDEYKRWLDA